MFRIGSQPPPQPATPVGGATSAQGGSSTSNQLQDLMAKLEQAIAALAQQQGGAHATGGDSMELPHIGGPSSHGVGMPGGTIGTHSMGFAPGEPAPAGVPKSGLAGASVGTQKSAHSHFGNQTTHHAHFGHHRPSLPPTGLKPNPSGMPGVTVGTHLNVHAPELPTLHGHSGSPGASIGTKTLGSQSTLQPAAAVASAPTTDPELARLLAGTDPGVKGGGGAVSIASGPKNPVALNNMGGGGLAGGVIGT